MCVMCTVQSKGPNKLATNTVYMLKVTLAELESKVEMSRKLGLLL